MTKLTELKNALVAWRKAEVALARFRLDGGSRDDARELRQLRDSTLDDLRYIADNDMAEIEQEIAQENHDETKPT